MRRLFFNILCLTAIVICAMGCEAHMEKNHLLISGMLIDDEGIPLPDILVSASVDNRTLDQQRSNTAGKFQFAFLESYDEAFEIKINAPYDDPDTAYTSYTYRNVSEKDEHDQNTYNLNTIVLSERVDFQLKVKQISEGEKNVHVNFSYQGIDCQATYRNAIKVTDKSECHPIKTMAIALNKKTPAFDRTSMAPKNTEVNLEYQIGDQAKKQVNITLTGQKNTYTLEY